MLKNRKSISAFAVVAFLLLSISTPALSTAAKTPPVQLKSPQNIVVTPTFPIGNFTVSWNSVPSASSYTVRVYNSSGNTLVGPAITLAVFVLTVTKSANTSYRVSVQAIGNGTTYSNSPESGKYSLTTFASTYAITWNDSCPDGINTCTTSSSGGASTYVITSAVTTIPTTAPAAVGYSFGGWFTQTAGAGTQLTNSSYTPASPYGAKTFYAKWTANTDNAITWDDQSPTTPSSGGSAFYTTFAAVATIPTVDPIKTGYSFGGWFTQTAGAGTQVTNGSYTPSTPYGAVTFYAKWTANSSSYAIGDPGPGGGIIYYYDSVGFDCGAGFTSNGSPTSGLCHYLEVAPSGWNTGADPAKVWAISTYQFADVSGITNDFSAYNNALGIGLGYKNSDLIVTQNGSAYNASTNNYAAGAARAYAGGSKNDWYLPTTAELNLLCQWDRGIAPSVTTACSGGSLNSSTYGATSAGFVGDLYWSSSEFDANLAWYQDFFWCIQNDRNKSGTRYVRPVQAF
jgi:uncharacterized repeat protein (TIGR02543 family)